jgi:hypothetical protein
VRQADEGGAVKRSILRRGLLPLFVLALVAAACGSEDEAGGGGGGSDVEVTTDLKTACGDRIVIQTDWFPEPEHGAVYQLIGPGGEIDKDKGAYTGEIGDTGVTAEIRSGGPFTGFQQVSAQMFQDNDILLGYVSSDEAVQNSAKLPTTAVMTPLEKNPQILMWDPEDFDFQEFADIGDSDATVLYFEGATYMEYMIGQGWIRREQTDSSYDGSPARFVTEENIVQQGFATNEPYKYENDIQAWRKPVDYLLIHDSGFEIYSQPLAVRTEVLEEERDCLKAIVPVVQQAQIDYINEPEPVNEELLNIVDEFASFWTLSEEGNEFAVEQMLELGIVGNGPDETLGNFDVERVQQTVDQLKPIFTEQNLNSFNPDVTAEEIVTNEFIDPNIGL